MSFEGHYQVWCHKGHEWRLPYNYGEPYTTEEETCPDCGAPSVIRNLVDDTNCDMCGLFLSREPLVEAPTQALLDAARDNWWACRLEEDPGEEMGVRVAEEEYRRTVRSWPQGAPRQSPKYTTVVLARRARVQGTPAMWVWLDPPEEVDGTKLVGPVLE